MDELSGLWPDPDKRSEALQRLLERVLADRRSGDDRRLTPAQTRVLFASSMGLEAPELAQVLGLSVHTVKTHLENARRLLAAKNTTHAVAVAIRLGVIP